PRGGTLLKAPVLKPWDRPDPAGHVLPCTRSSRRISGSLFLQVEPPLAEDVLGVRVRGSKKAFDTDPFVDLPSKTCELRPVHLAADVFTEAAPQPGFLGRARGNGDDN